MRVWHPRWLLFVVLVTLLGGCTSGTTDTTTDPFTIVEGDYRLHLSTTPTVLQAGVPVAFIVTVQNTVTSAAATDVGLRPIVEMDMPDGISMTLSTLEAETVAPGEFRITTVLEHAGAVTLILTLDTPTGLRSVRFAPIPVTAP